MHYAELYDRASAVLRVYLKGGKTRQMLREELRDLGLNLTTVQVKRLIAHARRRQNLPKNQEPTTAQCDAAAGLFSALLGAGLDASEAMGRVLSRWAKGTL